MQETNLRIREVEKQSKNCTDESYAHKKAAGKAESRANGLYDEGKRMRAKLKQEREWKWKTQQDVWIKGYETSMLEKENRANDKRRRMKEVAKAAKAARAAARTKKGKRRS